MAETASAPPPVPPPVPQPKFTSAEEQMLREELLRRNEMEKNHRKQWSNFFAKPQYTSSGTSGEAWREARYEEFLTSRRRIEDHPFYPYNQSNEKYVPYYNPAARDPRVGPHKRPPHPRERHRCDYHLEDIIQSIFDRKAPVFKCLKVYIKCLQSKPGNEPERLRTEAWQF